MERLKTAMTKITRTVWCHRAAYGCLAALYGAGCMGWVDKDVVAQGATALYAFMTAQRH